MRRLGNHKKFDQTKLRVVLESGHRNAGDAGTLMMEVAGHNYAPSEEIDLLAPEKETHMINMKFEPGNLAALKGRLIESLEARRAYGAARRSKRSPGETGS